MVKYQKNDLDAVFHALSDPTRRKIIGMLAIRDHCVGELVPSFSTSFVAISKHVKVLERVGLVARRVEGRNHWCALNTRPLNDAYHWLAAYETFWSGRLDGLESTLEEIKKEDSE
ncbi:ArsR/SmtB family transcription factor [Advenella mimigardefordensis]|uniref:Transcriptional regulator, ArsR family n=1 Tax=Advenella mimigardefordensis (strain DSM 17166 / LMG 22922 / DPN7) TaxID=1247726 RepID=W0P9I0_ADVMD|nr:metalloregulator ArsR/SmtB family transcription factor [Advenella mimigardefordensis]AHG62147.1 transcriptional regulator, ArsR family [Advenella mimigardefordensis DPN7]